MRTIYYFLVSLFLFAFMSNCTCTRIHEKQGFEKEMIVEFDSTRFIVRIPSDWTDKEVEDYKEQFPIKDNLTVECSCGDPNIELWTWDYDPPNTSIEIQSARDRLTGTSGEAQGDWPFSFKLPELEDKDQYKLTDTTDLGPKQIFDLLGLRTTSLLAPPNIDGYFDSQTTPDLNLGKRINIVVIDTGLDYYKNKDVKPFLYDTRDILDNCPQNSGWNFVPKNGSSDITDDHGHGTYVTRLITTQLKEGQYRILPVKVFNSEGIGEYWNIVCAFNYVKEILDQNEDLHIINTSFGYSFMQSVATESMLLDYRDNSIVKELIDEMSSKTLLIGSSGNSNVDIDVLANHNYPASFDLSNVVAVGGYVWEDQERQVSGNYGDESVHVAAPYDNFDYTFDGWWIFKEKVDLEGTSFSAAFTSSSFAKLIKQEFGTNPNPSLDASLIRRKFFNLDNNWIDQDPNLSGFIIDNNYHPK